MEGVMPPLYLRNMQMSKPLYINHTVVITSKGVYAQGKSVFVNSENEPFGAFGKKVYTFLNSSYPKYHKMDRISKLAFLSVEVLSKHFSLKGFNPDNTALVFANSSSTIETDNRFQESLTGIPSPSVFVYTLPNIMVGEICIRFGFKGENLFFVEPEINAEKMREQTELLFANSNSELCILGWVDFYSETNYRAIISAISYKEKGEKLTKEAIYSHFKTIEEWKN